LTNAVLLERLRLAVNLVWWLCPVSDTIKQSIRRKVPQNRDLKRIELTEDKSNKNSQTIEIKEALSPAEERVERWRRSIGLFVGPVVALILYLLPMPALNDKAHVLTAIIGWVVIWWITEPIPIPITAVLGAVLCVIFRIGSASEVFAPFADPIIFLFLGSFILAEGMIVNGLDKRFAYGIMSSKWIGNSSGRILLVFGIICVFLSMWISNTATTAMMYPIALGITYSMADILSKKTGKAVSPNQLRFGTAMMLMAAYGASVGGIGTPVGTPPNLIGIAMIEKFAHVKIPFFQWMLFAIPILIAMFVLLYFLMYYLHKPEISKIEGNQEYVKSELQKLGNWTKGQKNVLTAFLITVVLWVTPGFLAVIFGSDSPVSKNYTAFLPEGVAAMIGATLLFIMPTNWKQRTFTISWKQAVNIDWGTLLLFGGGLTLGNLMFQTKLADTLGQELMAFSGANSVWSITLVAIFIAIFLSETTSNTAAANMVIPVIIAVCLAAGINPVPPAIGATLGASYGFMLPVSTPPNAIVYGSGMVPIIKMIRAGIIFDILGGLVIWGGLWILLPLVGLA
jgi:sodium-dependent dicarboxylate transporter 2/3/5